MPKILILTGDAAESLEVMYPYQRLLEEGYEVHIAAPAVRKLQFVVHDFVDGFDTYTEKAGYTWPADVAFADVDPSLVSRETRRAGPRPGYRVTWLGCGAVSWMAATKASTSASVVSNAVIQRTTLSSSPASAHTWKFQSSCKART
jgi:hypothetical protein